ncbi:MAG: hypothetical protein HYX69_03105 [Planctomycetia bacterium]|nr:hypothetical protein [Planctomycetia bacterium]
MPSSTNWATGEPWDRPRRWPWRVLWGGALLVALLAIIIAVLSFRGQGERARRLEEIRARGEPTNLAELAAWYKAPPPDEDATKLWDQAGQILEVAAGKLTSSKLPYFGSGGVVPPPPGQPWEELELARQFLDDHADAMQLLHRAADLGGRARFPGVVPTKAMAGVTPDRSVMNMRISARAVALEANARAHAGDPQGALESIRAGLVLSQALADAPLLVAQLLRVATHGMMISEIKSMAGSKDLKGDDLAALQSTLEKIDFAEGRRRALVGERAFALTMFDEFNASMPRPLSAAKNLLTQGDDASYLAIMSDLIATCDKPWPITVSDTDALTASWGSRVSRRHVMTKLLLPAMKAYMDPFLRAETSNRLALIAVAVERYRRQKGHSPAELAALVPEFLKQVPDDPTSGEPFRYVVTDEGYALYSPTQRFPIGSDQALDAQTGANPSLLFAWPPRPIERAESPNTADEDQAPLGDGAPQDEP